MNFIFDETHRSGSLDSKKTEIRMRPILPSNLLISGVEFIEKQLFQFGPFFYLTDLWFVTEATH